MNRLLILGAGASHGHGFKHCARPPLSQSFFNHPIHDEIVNGYDELFNYITKVMNYESYENLDIEKIYTELEASWLLQGLSWKAILQKYGPKFVLTNPLDLFKSYILDMIYISTEWLQKGACPYHKAIVERLLSKGDAIISFNYDLIADVALQKACNWNEFTGYGFNAKTSILYGRRYYASDIVLLKPHGSINWMKAYDDESKDAWIRVIPINESLMGKTGVYGLTKTIPGNAVIVMAGAKEMFKNDIMRALLERILRERSTSEYDHFHNNGTPLVVMPSKSKPFREMLYAELANIWELIGRRLTEAREIVSIGFSFRDYHFNSILRQSVRERKKQMQIGIVTRSRESFDRISNELGGDNIALRHIAESIEEYVA